MKRILFLFLVLSFTYSAEVESLFGFKLLLFSGQNALLEKEGSVYYFKPPSTLVALGPAELYTLVGEKAVLYSNSTLRYFKAGSLVGEAPLNVRGLPLSLALGKGKLYVLSQERDGGPNFISTQPLQSLMPSSTERTAGSLLCSTTLSSGFKAGI